jgi:hypothetical protein
MITITKVPNATPPHWEVNDPNGKHSGNVTYYPEGMNGIDTEEALKKIIASLNGKAYNIIR